MDSRELMFVLVISYVQSLQEPGIKFPELVKDADIIRVVLCKIKFVYLKKIQSKEIRCDRDSYDKVLNIRNARYGPGLDGRACGPRHETYNGGSCNVEKAIKAVRKS